ncbi:MAG: hypothetical protein ACE37N_04170 [Pseudohongiellaceae bacterium]
MEKLVFRILETRSDLELFLSKVENYTSVKLPYEYASKSKMVGVYSSDKLVAGYMLVTRPTFRSLLFVPDTVKSTHTFFQNEQFELMEVNGLWIGPALKTPLSQLRVWFHLVADIFSCRKNYVLLMRNAKNKSMDRFMSMAYPEKLYEGAPIQTSESRTHNNIQVSYTTRWKIVLNFHKYFFELLRRQKRATTFAKNRAENIRAGNADMELT